MTITAGVLALQITEQGADQVEKKLTDIDKKATKLGSTPVKVNVTAPDLSLMDRQLDQLGKQVTLFKQGSQFASTKTQSLKELGQVEQQLRDIAHGTNAGLEQRIRAEAQLKQITGDAPAKTQTMATALNRLATSYVTFQAVVRGAGAIRDFIKNAIDAGDELHDLSIKTGVSTESLSVLQRVARNSGADTNTLAVGFRNLGKQVEALRSGGKQATETFAAIGLSAQDLEGLSLDQIFVKVANALSQFEDGSFKSTEAVRLFGRAGEQLLPTLDELANGGFERAYQKALLLGGVVGDDFTQRADGFNDALGDMNVALLGLGISAANIVLPSLLRTVEGVTSLTSAVGRYLNSLPSWVKTYVGALATGGGVPGVVFQLLRGNAPANPLDKDATTDAAIAEMNKAIKKKPPPIGGDPSEAEMERQRALKKAMGLKTLGIGDLRDMDSAIEGGAMGTPSLVGVDGRGKMKGVKAAEIPALTAREQAIGAKLTEMRERLTGLAMGVAESISGALVDGFNSAFSGDENFFAALGKSLLKSLGGILMQIGASMITYGALMTPLAGIPGPWQVLGLGAMASLAAGIGLLALGAGMGAIGGKGKGGGGGGGGGRDSAPQQPKDDQWSVAFDPDRKLRKGASAVAPASRALGSGPMPEARQAQVFNTTIIGPDDPKAQRAIKQMLYNANSRGIVGR